MSLELIAREAKQLTERFAAFPPVPKPYGVPLELRRMFYAVTKVMLEPEQDRAIAVIDYGCSAERIYTSVPEYWKHIVLPMLEAADVDAGQKARVLFEFKDALGQYYSRNGRGIMTELQERLYQRVHSMHAQIRRETPACLRKLYIPCHADAELNERARWHSKKAIENWMFLDDAESRLLEEFTCTEFRETGDPYCRKLHALAGKGFAFSRETPPQIFS